jgi:hypothetical protein
LAFLDEEQQEVVAQEEPERPRRFEGPERRRQQFLLRRLIAVGVGLGFVILIVVGIRGCLEARSDRGLRNYTEDVSTIMQESEQRGDEFFELVDSPGSTTEQQFEQQVSSQRNYAQSLLDRAESIGVPGQMSDAQGAVELSLKLRRNALQAIAENVGSATADRETEGPVETITNEMGSLYSSDVLWGRVASPEITGVLESEGVQAQELPAGNFMPEGTQAVDYLSQTTIVEKLAGITGAETTTGSQGLGLVGVAIGEVTLDEETTTEVPDDAREVTVDVQNQGEVDESGVTVTVTVNNEQLTKTIEELPAGDSTEVKLPITTLPQPGTEVQVEVIVEPVEGEAVTENNTANYTVLFGSESAEAP